VAFRARRVGHLDGQHRVVPQMRLFPVVLLFPLFLLLVGAGCMSGIAEAHGLPHALVADGTADSIDWMRRAASQIGVEVGMRRERLRILFEAFLVDSQMTRLAP